MTVAPARATRRPEVRPQISHPMLRETIGITVVLCALVPALMPLFQSGMPATHDGFLHVQRIIALEQTLHQGAPFTRWLPDLAYGYGQPLLLYYAPLSYVPALLMRLLGVGYALSFQVASGLALVLASLAMYLFGRSFAGPMAACVAAIVYGLLPYQLVDVYVRGALAESWAFVWLPLGSWCLLQAWQDRRRRWSVGLALCLAGLVLTHNVTALLFLPAIIALGIVLLVADRNADRAAFWPAVAAVGLGLALSAWFWMPAVVEKGLVQITETLEPDLFASFFLRSWPPFQVGPLYDYERPVSVALGSPIFWPQLGLVQVVVTLAGATALARASGTTRTLGLWAVLLVAGGMMLQAGSLASIYDVVPLLAFVQFPWRLLALVGLGSATLAGLLVEAVSVRLDFQAVLAAAVVGGSLVTAVARLHPEMTPIDERALSVETIARIELADYGLGTTHSGEYLPISSGQRNAARFRKTLLDAGSGGARQSQARPSDLKIERLDWRPDDVIVDVTSAAPDRLVLHQFAFPGWTARMDGAAVTVQPTGQLGLLGVDVPAGRHTVELTWGLTPLRAGAAGVSLLGILGLAILGSGRIGAPRPAVVCIAVASLLAAAMLPDWSSPNGETAPAVSGGAASQPVDDTLTLLGVQDDASRLASDRLELLRLTWLVRRPPTAGYRAAIEVRATDGTTHRATWDYEPLSRLWERGELVPTTVAVRLPPAFPPGAAQLHLVFERPDGVPPTSIGTLLVPPFRPDAASERATTGPGIDIGSDVRLSLASARSVGESVPPRVRAGGYLDVPLRWQALGIAPNVDRELVAVGVLHALLRDLMSEPGRPGDWFSPQPFWQHDEIVDQHLRIQVPPDTVPGTYPASVRVYSRDLARGGAVEPGAASARLRGQPLAELDIGDVTVTP